MSTEQYTRTPWPVGTVDETHDPAAQVARWEARIEEFATAARDAQDRANRAEAALREIDGIARSPYYSAEFKAGEVAAILNRHGVRYGDV